MLLRYDVLQSAYLSIKKENSKLIYLSPRGNLLTQSLCRDIADSAKKNDLCFLCGHYEGVDQRFVDDYVDQEISIGDYILFGGELAALVVIEGILRYIDGVIGNANSVDEESFSRFLQSEKKNHNSNAPNILLEHSQFTRSHPQNDLETVPNVLMQGNHKKIEEWKKRKQWFETFLRRSDLLKKATMTWQERMDLKEEISKHFSSHRKN